MTREPPDNPGLDILRAGPAQVVIYPEIGLEVRRWPDGRWRWCRDCRECAAHEGADGGAVCMVRIPASASASAPAPAAPSSSAGSHPPP